MLHINMLLNILVNRAKGSRQNTVIVWDFSTPLSTVGRSSRQKIRAQWTQAMLWTIWT